MHHYGTPHPLRSRGFLDTRRNGNLYKTSFPDTESASCTEYRDRPTIVSAFAYVTGITCVAPFALIHDTITAARQGGVPDTDSALNRCLPDQRRRLRSLPRRRVDQYAQRHRRRTPLDSRSCRRLCHRCFHHRRLPDQVPVAADRLDMKRFSGIIGRPQDTANTRDKSPIERMCCINCPPNVKKHDKGSKCRAMTKRSTTDKFTSPALKSLIASDRELDATGQVLEISLHCLHELKPSKSFIFSNTMMVHAIMTQRSDRRCHAKRTHQ